MKQTAVEWYIENVKSIEIEYLDDKITTTELDVIIDNLGEQAKEMERQQQDDFAIGFAEWCIKKRIDFFDSTEIGETYTINGFVSKYKMSELLEMFKKEKGL